MTQPIAIVLAAGKGTRMNSDRPKVLCEALGRPLIDYVVDALEQASVGRILVVIGYGGDEVATALEGRSNVEFVEQTEQLGTGHAVMVCRDRIQDHEGPIVVLAGDSPLVQTTSLKHLLDDFAKRPAACILGTLNKQDPAGLGRIVRDAQGKFDGIVEEKDASPAQRQLTEVNMSTYVFDAACLMMALDQLTDENRQREYYLTDCPGILRSHGKPVRALPVLRSCEALSVNTPDELKIVESEMQRMGY